MRSTLWLAPHNICDACAWGDGAWGHAMAPPLVQAPAPSGLRHLSGSALQLALSLPSVFDIIGEPATGYWFIGYE